MKESVQKAKSLITDLKEVHDYHKWNKEELTKRFPDSLYRRLKNTMENTMLGNKCKNYTDEFFSYKCGTITNLQKRIKPGFKEDSHIRQPGYRNREQDRKY